MPRTPNEFVVHLMLDGGHAQEVRFPTIQDFQKWYQGVIIPKFDSKEFVNVPIKNRENEYMVVRPASVIAIRVEPVYSSRPDFSDVE
ncbi:hypothetical protein BCD67_13250 [Oscillatoriales cyanobacterium USR001]|nr:hypothetical protein BCD67_13250 [Oscillatoriales cyanobacterium USR001]